MEESEKNSFNDEDRMESVAVEGQQVDIDMMSNEENQRITVDQVLCTVTEFSSKIEIMSSVREE